MHDGTKAPRDKQKTALVTVKEATELLASDETGVLLRITGGMSWSRRR